METEIYRFIIELVKTILNYGALGLALSLVAFIWWLFKNYDFTRAKGGKK